MMARFLAAKQGLFALFVLAGPLAAETLPLAQQLVQSGGAPGRVSSVLYHRLPEGFPVEVVAYNDTEADLEIRDRFVEELQKSGQLVAERAPLELSFTTEILQPTISEREPSLGRIGASNEQDRGTRGSDSGVDVELNVWSSTQDSVLGGRQPRRGDGRQSRFHISAQLRDRESGRVLWQGDAFCEMITTNQSRLARSMVGPLVSAYGRSVKDQPFEIE